MEAVRKNRKEAKINVNYNLHIKRKQWIFVFLKRNVRTLNSAK